MDLAARPVVVSSAASDMLTLFVAFTEFWVSSYAPCRGRPGRALPASPAPLESLYGAALDSSDVSLAGAMEAGEPGFATPLLPARLLPLVRMFVRQLHYAANTPLAVSLPPGTGASPSSSMTMSGKVDTRKSGVADWLFSSASASRLRADRQPLDSSSGPVSIELEKAVAQVNELKRCVLIDFVQLLSKISFIILFTSILYSVHIQRTLRI